jgi:hypothetical protein
MTDKRLKLGQFKTVEHRNFELYHAFYSACYTRKEIAEQFEISIGYVYLLLKYLKYD